MPKVVFDNIVYRDIFQLQYIELHISLLWQTYSFDTAFFIISFYVYFSSKYFFFLKWVYLSNIIVYCNIFRHNISFL